MKFVIFSLLIFVFALAPALAQTEKQIASMRAEVAAIDKAAAKYDKKSKNLDNISTEGAEATYYLSGRGLKKIVVKIYGETFRAIDEFYYSGEELIFAFQKVSRYNGLIGGNTSPKIARVEETRIYRIGDKTFESYPGKRF